MFADAASAAWLGCRDRQEASLAAGRAFARSVVEPSPLGDFARALDALDPDASAAVLMLDVLAALHMLLRDTQWVGEIVEAASAAARADPFFEPPFATLGLGMQQGLVLLDHPLAFVSLAVLSADAAAARKARGEPRSIGFPGPASLTRVLAGGGATVALWEAEDPGPDFSAANAARCRRVGSRRIATGDLLAVDGRTQTFAVDAFAGDLVFIRGEVRVGAAPLAREYDPDSGALVAVAGTDETASRTGLLLGLLRATGRRDAAPLIADVARHGPFYLRWIAMRELLALDPAAALPVLHTMAADDPHPEVRDAANQTQANLAERYPALFTERRAAA